MSNRFTHEYTLKTSDFDCHKQLKVTSLMFFLQDISTRHFESVVQPEEDALWVIVAWEIEQKGVAVALEKLRVTTQPIYFRKFIAYRVYHVENEQGDLIATAISKWAYLNRKTRRQGKIPQTINEVFGVPENALAPSMNKIRTSLKASCPKETFKCYFSDIDINQHVNNVVYVRWGIDALFNHLDLQDASLKLQSLSIQYKKEMNQSNVPTVITEVEKKGPAYETIQEIKNENDELCVSLGTVWTH